MPDRSPYFMQVMAEFFENWDRRAAFLDQLAAAEHEQEAFVLALCYIEALGHELYPECGGSARTFTKVLIEYGARPVFAAHHPRELKEWLARSDKAWARNIGVKVGPFLDGLVGRMFAEDELCHALAPILTATELKRLTPHFWHGTYAAIVYTETRNEAVHNFPACAIEFGVSTFGGEAVPTINYELLGPALKAILAHCKKVSFESQLYFGHDRLGVFAAPSSEA